MSKSVYWCLYAALAAVPAGAATIGADYFSFAYANTFGGQQTAFNFNQVFAQAGSQFTSAINPPTTNVSEVQQVASASASLGSSTLRTLGAASLVANPVGYNGGRALAQAAIGDTFSAQGSLSGYSLDLSIRVSGFTSFIGDSPTNYQQSYTDLGIFIFSAGQWDDSLGGPNLLYARNYALETNVINEPNRPPDGHIATHSTVTFNIPFDIIGSDFSMILFMGNSHAFTGDLNSPSHVSLNTFNSFSADYSHTVEVAASASNGITLTSASGAFASTLAPVPEPATFVPLAAGLAGLAVARFRRRRR